jgi:hypothetical protein
MNRRPCDGAEGDDQTGAHAVEDGREHVPRLSVGAEPVSDIPRGGLAQGRQL